MIGYSIKNFLFQIHFFMNNSILVVLFLGILGFFSISTYAQVSIPLLQATPAAMTDHAMEGGNWTAILELPFLLVSVFFAFATAAKMKDGKFGKGMKLLAWGFLVMAVGHLHMQVQQFTGINLFEYLLGKKSGSIAWSSALLVTWGLSALGLYYIYNASRGAFANRQ